MKQALLLVTFFTLLTATIHAQNTGNIKGTIKTSDNKPAPGVTVLIKDSKIQAVSKDGGVFSFTDLSEGTYTLITSFVGLQPQTKKVTLHAGETVITDFTLPESAQQLEEVVVTSRRTMNEKATSVGKIGIAARDLPQSVMVINKEVLDKQQVLQLSDVLKNVNGVYVMGTTGGTQEEIAARGYAFSSSNTFKNGVRYNNSLKPEMSALEKVEILKGSNAILYGNVSAGGALNLVTKKPQFERGGTLTMRAGSYDFYKPSIDIYGAVGNSKTLAYRVNGVYEKANSFRDDVSSERIYINPSLLYKLSDKTTMLFEADYLKDNRTLDYGTGAIDYQIANVPRSAFLGADWSYFKGEQTSATLTTTHKLNNNWELKNVTSFYNYNADLFGTTRPNASGNFVQQDGTWVRGVQRTGTDENYYFTEFDITGKFKTGFIKHALLAGFDADQYQTNTTAYNAIAKYDSINIFNLNAFKQRADIPELSKNTLTKANLNRIGAYVQDLISITDNLKLLAGVRYTYQETGSNVYYYAKDSSAKNKRYDDAVTPRFGIVYQPTKNISLFTSYSNSFVINSGIDSFGQALPPSFMDQYEAGIKTDLFNKRLSANVTLYKIVNSNLAQTLFPANANYPTAQELAGEVTSKGIEVDVATKPIQGFTVMAGYSYNDTRYTKSNVYVVGSKLRYNPQHTANASIFYNFNDQSLLRGLNIGVIAFYTGDRVAGRSTRLTVANDAFKLMPVPAFTTIDVAANYNLKNVAFGVKATNIFNVLSYYIHDDNSINPIAPRQFSASVALKL